MSAANFVLPLSSPEATVANAGGKGKNLARLLAGGFPVPDGFVMTTDAYRAFVEANGGAALTALPDPLDPDDLGALEEVAARIRARFEAGRVPVAVADALRAAHEKLGGEACAVAVRSSATAEDLPDLSFAGQQETYLNVVGRAALLEAVVLCWASLWTARAIAYRARGRVASDALSLAVVVQVLVPSEVSGVLFTANPLTGHRGEMVIDASFGLGEAVVAGQVEPDHFVVDTASFRVTARRLGGKAMAIVPKEGGGTEHRPAGGARASLDDGEVIELSKLARRVAEHFGAPQDVEWARAGGRWYLLQSRPITSLYPLPAGNAPDGPLRAFFNFNSFQGFPEPFTPLGAHALCMMTMSLKRDITAGPRHMQIAGGRLFQEVTTVARHPLLRRLTVAMLSNADPGAAQSLRRLIDAGRFGEPLGLGVGTWLRGARFWAKRLARLAATLIAPERMRARATAEVEDFVAQASANAGAAPDLPALLDAFDRDCEAALPRTLVRTGPVFAPGFFIMRLLDRWLEARLGFERGTGTRFARGVPGNVTTEMDLKLWALAQAVRADRDAAAAVRGSDAARSAEAYRRGELPEVLQRGLREFLDRYGARAVGEIDLGRPRWRDDPGPVLETLSSYLEIEEPAHAPDVVFAAGAREAERLTAECVARAARGPLGFVRAPLLRGAVRRVRLLLGLREYHKFAMVRVLGAYREALLERGRELLERGVLEREDDVFFVPPEQLRRLARGERLDLAPEVAERRAEHARESSRRQIPRVLLSTGEAFYDGVAHAGEGDLRGEGVSPGMVEGVVRVVLDPRGARLTPREILVCPATDPGWTPLFLSASGLVMEMGGMMTHGSVVAREYGLPAVVGVHQATTRLRTGQRIRVDGTSGAITLLDAAPVEIAAM
jgi:phosphohistidine swiveling domain-containing protein